MADKFSNKPWVPAALAVQRWIYLIATNGLICPCHWKDWINYTVCTHYASRVFFLTNMENTVIQGTKMICVCCSSLPWEHSWHLIYANCAKGFGLRNHVILYGNLFISANLRSFAFKMWCIFMLCPETHHLLTKWRFYV